MITTVKLHNNASRNLDSPRDHLRSSNLPQPASASVVNLYPNDTKGDAGQVHHQHDPLQSNNHVPSLLTEAIQSCKAAKNKHGKYPSIYEELVMERRNRWYRSKELPKKYNFLQMINTKLGGYMYATKLGVSTPRVLFCGKAKDIPQKMGSFGTKYVIKPLKGFASKGVKVVKDGVNILRNERVSYEILSEMYDGNEEQMMVEEVIESSNPVYDGLIPPDYKFFSYEGAVLEILLYCDHNPGTYCEDSFDVNSENEWTFLKEIRDPKIPQCSPVNRKRNALDPSRQKAMKDAAHTLAKNAGPNWIRIDMYDSKDHGPVLGEFTPFSGGGVADPLDGCVMSYLFVAHAERGGPNVDDYLTLHNGTIGNSTIKFKEMLMMKGTNNTASNTKSLLHVHGQDQDALFDFYPQEAHDWHKYDELTRCNKVMEAQQWQGQM